MTKNIDLKNVPAPLSELVLLVQAGNEVVFSQNNKPLAKLVSLPDTGQRVPGLHKGQIQTTADFDAPLSEDFLINGK